MTEPHAILARIFCVRLEYHLYTGRKRLTVEDLRNVDPSQVPPQHLASLGSKQICDRKEIQHFQSVFRRAERLCTEHGTRFMDVFYAMSAAQFEDLRPELDRLRAEIERLAQSFASRFQAIIEAWRAQHPDWRRILEMDSIAPKDLAQRFSLRYHVCHVAAVEGQAATMTHAVSGLTDALFADLAILAATMYTESLTGGDKTGQWAVKRLSKARDKLDALSFVDARIGNVVAHMDASLASLPAQGPITGQAFNALIGLVSLLMDRDRLLHFAEACAAGTAPVVLRTDEVAAPAPAHTGFMLNWRRAAS